MPGNRRPPPRRAQERAPGRTVEIWKSLQGGCLPHALLRDQRSACPPTSAAPSPTRGGVRREDLARSASARPSTTPAAAVTCIEKPASARPGCSSPAAWMVLHGTLMVAINTILERSGRESARCRRPRASANLRDRSWLLPLEQPCPKQHMPAGIDRDQALRDHGAHNGREGTGADPTGKSRASCCQERGRPRACRPSPSWLWMEYRVPGARAGTPRRSSRRRSRQFPTSSLRAQPGRPRGPSSAPSDPLQPTPGRRSAGAERYLTEMEIVFEDALLRRNFDPLHATANRSTVGHAWASLT